MRNRFRPARLLLAGMLALVAVGLLGSTAGATPGVIKTYCGKAVQPRSFCLGDANHYGVAVGDIYQNDVVFRGSGKRPEMCSIIDVYNRFTGNLVHRYQKCAVARGNGDRLQLQVAGAHMSKVAYVMIARVYNRSSFPAQLWGYAYEY